MHRIKSIKLFLIAIILALLVQLPAFAAYVSLPNGELRDSHTDLSVKVLGGTVSIDRTWVNGRWYFNPAWADLKFKLNPINNEVLYVDRAGTVYEQSGNRSDIFVFDYTHFIRRITSSTGVVTWRWYDRLGHAADFDAQGRMTGYTNRAKVKVSFIRNAAGLITEVRDHFDALALKFTYTTTGTGANQITHLSKVQDRTDREVNYTWAGKNLTEVKDVLGYVWKYGYDNNGQITKITDPELAVTEVTYIKSFPVDEIAAPLGISFSGKPGRDFRISRIGLMKNPKLEVTEYNYEYNRAEQQFVVIEFTPPPFRRRIERRYDIEGRQMWIENGDRMEYERRRDGPLIDYVKNERGLITRTDRDLFRNIRSVTHANGTTEKWEYHPVFNFVTKATDELGRIYLSEYNSIGQLINKTTAAGTPQARKTEFEYDQYGQMNKMTIKGATVAGDAVTEYAYDNYGNRTKVTDAEGNVMEYKEFNVMGQAKKHEDAENHTTEMTYNAAGWMMQSKTALGFISEVKYDKVGNRTSSEVILFDKTRAITTFEYDDLDRLIKTTDPLSGITIQKYDEEGRMTESSDARLVKTKLEYDATGRMVKVIDGNNNETETVYGTDLDALEGLVAARIYPTYKEEYLYDERDRQKQVTQVLSEQVQYKSYMDYDAVGNVISQLDAKLRASQRSYDALNRLTQEVDSRLGETNYRYDVRDNLTHVTDAKGQTHTFTYDLINRKLTEARPMGQTIGYKYNANSELVERNSPNGAKREYFYDADHRLTEEKHFLPSQTTASKTITYNYYADSRGLLKSFDDGLTKSAYEYDKKGQRTKETVTFGNGATAVVKVIERTYELNGLLKTLTYPGSVGTQTYTYDANNQHASTKIPGLAAANDTLAYTYRWNAIETVTMPGNLKRTVTLDPLQRPTKIEVKGTGNLGIPVLNHRYEYDEVSNITKKTTLDGIYEYAYDEQDRLTDANPPDNLEAGSNGLPVESYQYDGVHNRMNSGHQPGQWVYNANNELNTWGIGDNKRALTYDDNGSTTKEVIGEPASKTTDYVYDAQDRLIEVKNNAITVAKYAYDPMGRRVWRETFGADASTTWFLYSDEGLIGEYNQNGAPVREYGWNPGGLWGTDPVWQKDSSGIYLAHNDHLFTTDRLTKATDGRVAWTGVREAFGKTSVAANSQVTYLLRFPGQWEDSVGGFNQNWFREYQPRLGRFSEFDPIGLISGVNSYQAVEQNPVKSGDPTGLLQWNGVYGLLGGSLPIGPAGLIGGSIGVIVFDFYLESECVENEKWKVRVIAETAAISYGIALPFLEAGVSSVTFEDYQTKPNPYIFEGPFSMETLGTFFYAKCYVTLGNTFGDCSGVALSTDIAALTSFTGYAAVLNAQRVPCCN